MSLVGTRPPTVDEWDKYELHHRARLATKPGLTGMWQVSGRSNITDFEEVVKLDKQYISEYVIGNKEQTNSAIYFEIKVNPQNPQKEDFKVNIANANNHELLNYAKFMDELAQVKDLHIYALNAKKDFIAGIINKSSLILFY